MHEGEYAVHYSTFKKEAGQPFCMVFGSRQEAEAFAKREVTERPELRCTIYDHRGFVGAPLRDLRGSTFKAASDISPRFRRWVGSILFFGGIALTLLDWSTGFKLSWPAMIGTRMLIPGLVLLFIEAMVMLHARLESRGASDGAAG